MASVEHTLVALVQDKPGVLTRIASMFRRRGFNIASLAVGRSELPRLSRMTFVVEGDEATVEQVTKHLRKLVDVIKVTNVTGQDMVYRELALMRVRTTPATRGELVQIVDIFRANIIDVAPDSLIIEVTGDEDKLSSLYKLLKDYGVVELMRTGRIAMTRGAATEEGASAPARRRLRRIV